jgi:hypothetical protein
MRKAALILTAALIGLSPASASEVDAYKKGFADGVRAGAKIKEQTLKEEVSAVWDLIDAALSYRHLFLAGEVPPPVVIDKTVVKKEGPAAVIERKLEFLPPAYFPVDRIEALRETLGEKIVIPKGYVVFADARNLPIEKIALYSSLARKKGINAVYSKKYDAVYFGSYDREADAQAVASSLKAMGIEAEVAKADEDIEFRLPPEEEKLKEELVEISKKLVEKEKRLYSLPEMSFKKGLNGVIYYLQKALAAADTISTRKHPDFNVVRLREDIRAIINEINNYLAQRQPYRRIIVPADYAPLSNQSERITEEREREAEKKLERKLTSKSKLERIKKMLSNQSE